ERGSASPLPRRSSKRTANTSGTKRIPAAALVSSFRYPRAPANQATDDMALVLVIDDDQSLLRALRLGLEAGGHGVVSAMSGEQGISQAALKSPDVVVLDMGLPDL